MNAGEVRRISDLEDSVHRLHTELGRFPVQFPYDRGDSDYGTFYGVVRTPATSVDASVAVWDIEILHKPGPPDTTPGERTDAGTYLARNIFRQDWSIGDDVVVFETQGEQTSVTPSPGLAEQSADDLAASSSDDLAGYRATTAFEVSGAQWWAFKPGGAGPGIGYFEITDDLAIDAVAAQAKPVLLDGSRNDAGQTVWLIDDNYEDLRFHGLKQYTDLDGSATVHAGYRYFAYYVTDNYNATGLPGYRIIDGEAPLQRITVQLADGDVINDTGNVKVKEWPFDREGYPDNGRFPQIQGEASPGAGGGLYFFARDVYELFQGESDPNAKYIVRWSAEQELYIFDEKLGAVGGLVSGVASTDVSRGTATFELTNLEALQGTKPPEPLTVANTPNMQCFSGRRIYAQIDNHNNQWVVAGENVQYIEGAKGLGQAVNAVSGQSSFSVNSIIWREGEDPAAKIAADALTVDNPFDFDLDAGGYVEIVERLDRANPATHSYYAIQAQCPATP